VDEEPLAGRGSLQDSPPLELEIVAARLVPSQGEVFGSVQHENQGPSATERWSLMDLSGRPHVGLGSSPVDHNFGPSRVRRVPRDRA